MLLLTATVTAILVHMQCLWKTICAVHNLLKILHKELYHKAEKGPVLQSVLDTELETAMGENKLDQNRQTKDNSESRSHTNHHRPSPSLAISIISWGIKAFHSNNNILPVAIKTTPQK